MKSLIAVVRKCGAARNSRTIMAAAVVSSLMLSGCANMAPHSMAAVEYHDRSLAPSVVPPSESNKGKNETQTQAFIRLTPWTAVGGQLAANPSSAFAGAYTRLLVTGAIGDGGNSDAYEYLDRGPLARFFAGSHRTVNLTAKVSVGDKFSATVPLVTVDHVSDSSSGEVFSRTVNHSVESYPLFLVHESGSNENVSVIFEVKATDQYQASASAAIAAVQSVLKTVAPHAAVLTTLTQQSSKDAATALDSTLGKLLASTLDEAQQEDYDIRLSAPNQGSTIALSIPDAQHEGEWNAKPLHPVGTWLVSFADPRPSIFSDRAICVEKNHPRCSKDFDTAAAEVTRELKGHAYEVLNYQLVKDAQSVGTIIAYIKTQDWYTSAQKWMNSDKIKDSDATSFCSSVRQAMVALELNSFDADTVLWALGTAGNFPKSVNDALNKKGNNCLVP